MSANPTVDRSEANSIEDVIINTVSLRSIRTSKKKGTPVGSFEFTLAPTKNWVSTITPGSWVCIFMTQEGLSFKDLTELANRKKLKMVGRVESVRVVTKQRGDGARVTEYLVSGVDWCHIFDSKLYVDPLLYTAGGQKNAYGAAGELLRHLGNFGYDVGNALSSDDMVQLIIDTWGKSSTSEVTRAALNNRKIIQASQKLSLPEPLAKYLGKKILKTATGGLGRQVTTKTGFADLIDHKSGPLTRNNFYDKNVIEGTTIFNPVTLAGQNSIWELMKGHNNNSVRELICDLDWVDDDANPRFTLWNRIKPFAIRKIKDIAKDNVQVGKGGGASHQTVLTKLISPYKFVQKYKIAKEDVILLNAGTNWKDRYNFVEVNLNRNLPLRALANAQKLDSQFWDAESISRDGFKPIDMNTNFLTLDSKNGNDFLLGINAYKYIAKEWYFDTHRMLNGSVRLVGQSCYITVGSNILIPAEVVAPSLNFSKLHTKVKGRAYLMAHVENVGHEFGVDEKGARSFFTEIHFVRGIITDVEGNALSSGQLDSGLLEDNTSQLTATEQKNHEVFGTSSENDPDVQKLRGN